MYTNTNYSMSISQGIYTQCRPDHQTKCSYNLLCARICQTYRLRNVPYIRYVCVLVQGVTFEYNCKNVHITNEFIQISRKLVATYFECEFFNLTHWPAMCYTSIN